jgi:hypothetical protein
VRCVTALVKRIVLAPPSSITRAVDFNRIHRTHGRAASTCRECAPRGISTLTGSRLQSPLYTRARQPRQRGTPGEVRAAWLEISPSAPACFGRSRSPRFGPVDDRHGSPGLRCTEICFHFGFQTSVQILEY